MMNRNKQKGKYLERKVVELFRLNNIPCHRAYTSGTGDREVGDIIFDNHDIIVECKNTKSFSIFMLFKNNKMIHDYLNQLEKEKHKYVSLYNRIPLSILAINNYEKRSGVYTLVKKKDIQSYLDRIDTYLQYNFDYILLRLEDLIQIIKEDDRWLKKEN